MTETLMTPYSTEKIVESYNMFLNTDDATLDGQNYKFQFGNNSIMTRNKDQYIRLTLLNFNMYKNWTDVNNNNDTLVLKQGGVYSVVKLPNQNYASLHDLAKSFGNAVVSAINGLGLYGGVTLNTTVLPPASASIAGTSNNILTITIDTTNPHGIVASDLTDGSWFLNTIIDTQNIPGGLLLANPGADAGLLLGADRLPATTLVNSFNVDITNANKIIISSKYPAQRSTEPNVYMRINPTPQIYASEAFDTILTTSGENKLNPSNILAEIKIDTEFVQYTPTSDKEFFCNMYQNSINHLDIRLTDSRNRNLPLYSLGQATTGNRYFTSTLRVDIVQDVAYGQASAAGIQIPHKYPARFDSNLLMKHKHGKSNYGNPAGY